MRIACVDIPAFPLQRLLKRHPSWRAHPAAVVDRDKAQGTILWVNEAARKHRILPGMRYAAGLSLSRELRAGTVPDEDIQTGIDDVVQLLLQFTADVEPSEEPGVFWLNAAGLSLLYPSLSKWADQIHDALQAAGYVSSVVVGFSRFGSYAAAKAAKPSARTFREPLEEESFTQAIPIDRLGFEPALRDALAKLGVRTLGRFLELPPTGLLRRFGKEIHRLHRMARGDLWSPLQPTVPLEPIERSLRLDYGERDVARLMHLVKDLLRGLMPRLARRNQVLSSMTLHCVQEDGSESTEELKPAAPTFDQDQLLELAQLRLETTPFAAGVVDITLRLEGVVATREQLELFVENRRRDPRSAARAMARLRAEFGNGVVRQAYLSEGHLPEARFQWKSLQELPAAAPRVVQTRPLVRRFLPRPVALSRQRRNEPDGWLITGLEDGPVEEIVGPYIVSGGWWRREVHREYHFIRTRRGGWLWVFFDRRKRRWFLQGTVE